MDSLIRYQNGSRILVLPSLSKITPPAHLLIDNKMWSDEETIVLLDIWGSDNIQNKLATMKRNRLVWEEVAKLMEMRGYIRSPKQCCGKIHNMKVEFRKVKTMKKDSFKFFDIMDPIMANDEALAKSQESGSETASMAGDDHNYGGTGIEFAPPPLTANHDIGYQGSAYQHQQQLHFDRAEDDQILQSVKMEAIEPEMVNHNEVSNLQIPEELPASNVTAPDTRMTNVAMADRPYPITRPKKRRHQCQGAGLVSVDVVFDKLRQMQEESDKRFYAWEERRLRLEQEFEERRQRIEAEKEVRRERFIMQLISTLAPPTDKTKHQIHERIQINRPIQPAPPAGMPRIHTIISTNPIGIRQNRTGELFAGNRPAGGRL